ncbi:hypothetical protein HW130_34300 [Streptomyces sp. PKU-EA00015]|uniref:hypothetical protein n=1 Tax=Streptomyces sp. PKU-EA00015 TaxID=2748326 RepID=UPI0015A1C631|nr:hypothetical protein [Streptomyces sp. PKU-EA00015]NWF31242.1 hypothetical protein [Streptomyces sp. PKU-EA00015]
MNRAPGTVDLLRHRTPQVLGALVRRCGRFGLTEDAVQEWPDAVRAHPLDPAGDSEGVLAACQAAARHTLSLPEARHLRMRAARLAS